MYIRHGRQKVYEDINNAKYVSDAHVHTHRKLNEEIKEKGDEK